jgi:hypothetical protein
MSLELRIQLNDTVLAKSRIVSAFRGNFNYKDASGNDLGTGQPEIRGTVAFKLNDPQVLADVGDFTSFSELHAPDRADVRIRRRAEQRPHHRPHPLRKLWPLHGEPVMNTEAAKLAEIQGGDEGVARRRHGGYRR